MRKLTALIIFMAVVVLMGIFSVEYFKPAPVVVPTFNLNVITTPTTTVLSGPVILEAIQNQAQLETVSILIANDRDVTRVWGFEGVCREKVTYLGYYTITAGVDLQNITPADIQVAQAAASSPTAITLTLPPARVLHVELDTQLSRVVHHEISIISQLCGTQLPEMVMEAQYATQTMAANTALEEDILQQAQDRAGFELQKMLLAFGVSNVIIQYR